jgi:hypothetical protein
MKQFHRVSIAVMALSASTGLTNVRGASSKKNFLPPFLYTWLVVRFYTEDEAANNTEAVVIFHLDYAPSSELERSTYSTFGCPPLGIRQLLVLIVDVGVSIEL